jgi:protein TonB
MIRNLSVAILTVAMLSPLSAFQEPYAVGNGVSAPSPTVRVQPAYTAEAKAAKIQGTVTLRLVVDRNGEPRDVEVVKPLEPGLDLNAMQAVTQWRFEPGRKDGLAVDVIANIEINFRLL